MKLCLAIFQNYMSRLRQRFIINISKLNNLNCKRYVFREYKRRRGRKIKI